MEHIAKTKLLSHLLSLFFFVSVKVPQNYWPTILVWSSKQTGAPETHRGSVEGGNSYNLCDDFGWISPHMVCALKSIGETQTCSKFTLENKHNSHCK